MTDPPIRETAELFFPELKETDLRPCPVCRKEDRLWFGIESNQTSGAGCRRCRLKVTAPWTERTPRAARTVPDAHWANWMYLFFAAKALETWNKIPREPA